MENFEIGEEVIIMKNSLITPDLSRVEFGKITNIIHTKERNPYYCSMDEVIEYEIVQKSGEIIRTKEYTIATRIISLNKAYNTIESYINEYESKINKLQEYKNLFIEILEQLPKENNNKTYIKK